MKRLHQHRPKTARRYAAAVTWRLAFRENFNQLQKPSAAMSGSGACTHRSAPVNAYVAKRLWPTSVPGAPLCLAPRCRPNWRRRDTR